MKKLLVVSIVALAAFYSQAAAVAWKADWSYSKNASMGVDTFDDSGNYTYWVVALGGSSTAGLEVDGDGNLVLGSGMTQVGSPGVDSEDMAGSISGLYGISGALAVSGIKDSPPQNGNTLVFSNDGGDNADGVAYMMANLPTESIPEPTSGLLLLIGGSLLALRRKQK